MSLKKEGKKMTFVLEIKWKDGVVEYHKYDNEEDAVKAMLKTQMGFGESIESCKYTSVD